MRKKSISPKWLKIIKSWEQSGLTQKRFCEENGLNFNTFTYYRKNSKQPQQLVELPALPSSTGGTPMIEVHLRSSNIELRIPENVNRQTLSNLFDLLGVAHVS